jgi:succinate dehydrogenase / fumarate reductase iron-sulfur subunit/fumarate reductase iron-sulfur subunit
LNVQVASANVDRCARRRLTVAIARTDDAAETHFDVDVVEPAVVLDVLLAVQRLDPTLGFRYSCRVSMCGTCAVRVDGRPALACQTPIETGSESLTVEPLAGLPVVRDLIVDTTPFWDAWRKVEPWFEPRADGVERTLAAGDPSRAEVEAGLDCIGCGVCWTACDLTRGRNGFIGPAALNRTMVLAADPRDGARARRLRIAGGEGGVTRCHYVHGCSGACPKGLDPAASIRRLRRWGIRA